MFFSSLLPLIPKKIPKSLIFLEDIDYNGKKLAVKKSYLVFLWLHYLSKRVNTTSFKIKIKFLKTKHSLVTLPKAPMAHKKTSKEQFFFKFFQFKVFFKTYKLINKGVSVHAGKLLHGLSFFSFPIFETNLLFLKFYFLKYPVKDSCFFTYKTKK